ncbi:hypothetical protein CI610_02910 [invertebrate metagenome]|uniref:Tyr recombinase domain-containing protein n=1 Tax=invertebrate metagenome TaxID=1711999 RepID=A0A2H9T4J6_9ZZZZ
MVPISAFDLGRYVAYLSHRLCFVSIRNYLSVVRLLHIEAGYSNPLQSHYINSVLKGARRVLGDQSSPKLPITPAILLSILKQLDLSCPADITFWAACTVAFFSFFRKSNLFPPPKSVFTPGIHLCRDSVVFTPDGAVLSVNWTKTIQFRQRTLAIPLPRINRSPLCPAQALLLSFKISPTSSYVCPLFMYRQGEKLLPLTYAMFISRLKQCLATAGLDPSLYSGHSFRRGGATFALECGLSPDMIQSQGDWKSLAYQRYLDPSLSARHLVVKTMASHIRELNL